MILDWRKNFETEFPFYMVQIAPWSGYSGEYSAVLREQQEKTSLSVRKTGMIAIGDLVVKEVEDIHPKSKTGVGNRLANLALKEVYGNNDLQPYYPRFENVVFEKNKAFIIVKSIEKLKCNSKDIISFTIAGNDRVFHPAIAKIEKDGRISVVSQEVKEPASVRYCFTADKVPNLFDSNGLPLLPFRTDSWELSTK